MLLLKQVFEVINTITVSELLMRLVSAMKIVNFEAFWKVLMYNVID